MDLLLWILLPGGAAVATGMLAWFVMQSRMDVALAWERENLAGQREALAERRGELKAERSAMETTFQASVRAAEECARRKGLEEFLHDLRVEQRHFTREDRRLPQGRRCLVLQERMYFRGIPLSDWIEHDMLLEEGADVDRIVRDMTVFDSGVVSIAEVQRPMKTLAARAT
ncbi:MAG: hypothetical protein ABSC23_15950 [Bryobacteraceae bacterium]|jgi:hypothetical protein